MEFESGAVKSVNLNGSSLQNILSTGSSSTNYDLVVYGDYIFCTNDTKIIKLQKYPGTSSQSIHMESKMVTSVLVYMENGN